MLGMAFFFSSYAPVRTGHLAKERPISWSLSSYLYSWLSGLVQLLYPLIMVLGGHGFSVVDGLFWYTLLEYPFVCHATFCCLFLSAALMLFLCLMRIARLSSASLFFSASLTLFVGQIRSRGG